MSHDGTPPSDRVRRRELDGADGVKLPDDPGTGPAPGGREAADRPVVEGAGAAARFGGAGAARGGRPGVRGDRGGAGDPDRHGPVAAGAGPRPDPGVDGALRARTRWRNG